MCVCVCVCVVCLAVCVCVCVAKIMFEIDKKNECAAAETVVANSLPGNFRRRSRGNNSKTLRSTN